MFRNSSPFRMFASACEVVLSAKLNGRRENNEFSLTGACLDGATLLSWLYMVYNRRSSDHSGILDVRKLNEKRPAFPLPMYSVCSGRSGRISPEFFRTGLGAAPVRYLGWDFQRDSIARGFPCRAPGPLKVEASRGAMWDIFPLLRLSNCGKRILCSQSVAYRHTAHA